MIETKQKKVGRRVVTEAGLNFMVRVFSGKVLEYISLKEKINMTALFPPLVIHWYDNAAVRY